MSDRAVLYISMKRINITKTQERASGIYLTVYRNGIDYPEKLRKALSASREYWLRPHQSALGIVALVGGLVDADNIGLSTEGEGINRIKLPIIVVDPHKREVAFAVPGDETDPTKWYEHYSFVGYVGQSQASYPAEVLSVYHLRRMDKTTFGSGRDEQHEVVVLAFSEKHARHLAASGAGDEGHEEWLREDAVSCEALNPATMSDKTPRVICQDFLAGG